MGVPTSARNTASSAAARSTATAVTWGWIGPWLPWVFASAVPVGLLAILFGWLLPQRPLRGADELADAGIDAVVTPG